MINTTNCFPSSSSLNFSRDNYKINKNLSQELKNNKNVFFNVKIDFFKDTTFNFINFFLFSYGLFFLSNFKGGCQKKITLSDLSSFIGLSKNTTKAIFFKFENIFWKSTWSFGEKNEYLKTVEILPSLKTLFNVPDKWFNANLKYIFDNINLITSKYQRAILFLIGRHHSDKKISILDVKNITHFLSGSKIENNKLFYKYNPSTETQVYKSTKELVNKGVIKSSTFNESGRVQFFSLNTSNSRDRTLYIYISSKEDISKTFRIKSNTILINDLNLKEKQKFYKWKSWRENNRSCLLRVKIYKSIKQKNLKTLIYLVNKHRGILTEHLLYTITKLLCSLWDEVRLNENSVEFKKVIFGEKQNRYLKSTDILRQEISQKIENNKSKWLNLRHRKYFKRFWGLYKSKDVYGLCFELKAFSIFKDLIKKKIRNTENTQNKFFYGVRKIYDNRNAGASNDICLLASNDNNLEKMEIVRGLYKHSRFSINQDINKVYGVHDKSWGDTVALYIPKENQNPDVLLKQLFLERKELDENFKNFKQELDSKNNTSKIICQSEDIVEDKLEEVKKDNLNDTNNILVNTNLGGVKYITDEKEQFIKVTRNLEFIDGGFNFVYLKFIKITPAGRIVLGTCWRGGQEIASWVMKNKSIIGKEWQKYNPNVKSIEVLIDEKP
jgi:hypothetical protein